jgi:hypothetical protein
MEGRGGGEAQGVAGQTKIVIYINANLASFCWYLYWLSVTFCF